MNFNDIVTDFKNMSDELDQIRLEYQQKMQDKFKFIAQAFFVENPTIQAIVWDQYTPYFADGDECIFGVYDLYFVRNNFDKENLERSYAYEEEEYDAVDFYYRNDHEDPILIENCKAFNKIVHGHEDLMKEVFGNHVTVYLTKDEVFTAECEHD